MPTLNSSRYGFVLLATLSVLASCGGGGGGGGTGSGSGGSGGGGGSTNPPVVPPPNRAPAATNDAIRVDGAALTSINVLTNDTDADSDKLTVSITEPALIGAASVNADGTVRLASLPGDFKGYTRFKYRVTDPAGLTSDATAAIFVGVDPFRVVLAGDPSSNGSIELFLANLIAAPVQISAATEGVMKLTGFVASTNGSTVVYRRTSTSSASTTDLSFVKTATPKQDVRIGFPAGVTLGQTQDGRDPFAVSSDGQWIAAIARDGSSVDAVYMVNVSSPTTVTKVDVPGTVRVALPRFSADSKSLYVLASPATNGDNDDLYTVALNSGFAVTQLSAPTPFGSNDDVLDYSVASDQSRIILRANRGGRVGLYFIDPTQLQTETKVNQNLGLTEIIQETTVGQPTNAGGSILTGRVAYTVQSLTTFTTWLADVSATPTPHVIASSGARVRGFRPDDGALTYTRSGQIYEASVAGNVSDQLIGAGVANWYDSTGNIVLLQQFLPSGGSPSTYPALAVAVRGSFGTTTPLGTPVLAAHYLDASGFDRGVAIIGEGATTGTPPTSAKLVLVNAMAPEKLIPLADFTSPLQLAPTASQVVRN